MISTHNVYQRTPQSSAVYRRFNDIPADSDIYRIPQSKHAVFSLRERELGAFRRHLYAINKSGIRRFRTMIENGELLVWRIK